MVDGLLPLLLLAPSVVLEVLPQPVSTVAGECEGGAERLDEDGVRCCLQGESVHGHPSLEVTGLSMWLMYGICRAGTLGTRLCLRRHHKLLLPVVPGGI